MSTGGFQTISSLEEGKSFSGSSCRESISLKPQSLGDSLEARARSNKEAELALSNSWHRLCDSN